MIINFHSRKMFPITSELRTNERKEGTNANNNGIVIKKSDLSFRENTQAINNRTKNLNSY